MNHQEKNLFELKATKKTKDSASPRQVVAEVSPDNEQHAHPNQIAEERHHDSTSMPSSAQNASNNLNNSGQQD